MNRTGIFLGTFLLALALNGCETVHKGGEAVGSVIGETTSAVGSVTDGGAKAVQGKEKPGDNPYGR